MTQPQRRPITSADLLALLPEPQMQPFEARRVPGNTYQVSREMLGHQIRQTLETVWLLALANSPATFVDILEATLGISVVPGCFESEPEPVRHLDASLLRTADICQLGAACTKHEGGHH